MKVLECRKQTGLAAAYVGELADGSLIEFVESVQPPMARDQKWVLIVSTLKGCPMGCRICDASGYYHGPLTATEILDQFRYMVLRRYPDGRVPAAKFKVQFARMGEPTFNVAVLDVLRMLPTIVDAPGLMPCLSTVAPAGCLDFLNDLESIKDELYSPGRFQMQFSVHTTCPDRRRELVPVRTWSLQNIADFGETFHRPGDRKIGLNFAVAQGYPVDADEVACRFDPARFMVKLTPVNPSLNSRASAIYSGIDPCFPESAEPLASLFRDRGFDTVVSIGQVAENDVRSNCGLLVRQHLARERATTSMANGQTRASL